MNLSTVSSYVLRALALAQMEGRVSTLATLTAEIRVRKTDVRTVVTSLDREGFVDALRMRLTLKGFAIGSALIGAKLPELREARPSVPSPVKLTICKAA